LESTPEPLRERSNGVEGRPRRGQGASLSGVALPL
jgi:hypothetical protein